MTPPKRGLFSLNVDSYIESAPLHEERRLYHHNGNSREGTVKKAEVQGPVTGSTHIEIVKNADEKIRKTIKKSASESGPARSSDQASKDSRAETLSYTTRTADARPSVHTRSSPKEKEIDINEQYDTTDL